MLPNSSEILAESEAAFLESLQSLAIADIFTMSLLFVISCISNVTLLAMEIKFWFRRRTISLPKAMIVSLSCIDLVASLFGILPRLLILGISSCLEELFLGFHVLCFFTVKVLILLSQLTAVLMGIERVIAIQAPFFYTKHCTNRIFIIFGVILLVYSSIFGSFATYFSVYIIKTSFKSSETFRETISCHNKLLAFEFEHKHDLNAGEVNFYVDVYNTFQFIQTFLLNCTLLLCNTGVIRGLNRMNQRLRECRPSRSGASSGCNRLELPGSDFSNLMISINVVVIVLTTPQSVRQLYDVLHFGTSVVADFACQRLLLCSICVNPFLYGLLRQKIRQRLKRRLLNIFPIFRSNAVTPLNNNQSLTNSFKERF